MAVEVIWGDNLEAFSKPLQGILKNADAGC